MPVHPDAEKRIRGCFSAIKRGNQPRRVEIGNLCPTQLAAINAHRAARNMAPIEAAVLFTGKHVYESRVLRDGYSADDVVQQIISGMAAESVLMVSQKMTVLQNPNKRNDGYGALVNDQVVLECTSRHPHPVLYSTIPKGDRLPLCKEEGPQEEDPAALLEVTNPLG